MALTCAKCLDRFYKQARYDKHIAKCPGKVCRVCGKVGHLACGVSESAESIQRRIQETLLKGETVTIHALF